MELESLKYIWKQMDESAHQQSDDKVIAMLNKKSKSTVAKMKRNLFFEMILAIIFYVPLIVYYLLGFNGKLSGVAWFMLFILAIFIVYYYLKNKLLKEMLCVGCQVKANLQRQATTLEKYVRFYFVAGTILIPVTILFLGILMYWKLPPPPAPTPFYITPGNPLWKVILLWFVLLILTLAFIYFANIWYVNKLYGRHINKLKQLLAEMNEE